MKKNINTLIPDIYSLFTSAEGKKVNLENLNVLTNSISAALQTYLGSRKAGGKLRVSSIGKPDRQVWYECKGYSGSPLDGPTLFKFLIGHIYEAVILFLAKEAGHEVSREQEEIDVLGIKGHQDATIDGVTIDIKTASDYSFQKFSNGKLLEEDGFGYIPQISAYKIKTGGNGAGFLAVNKVNCEMTLLMVPENNIVDPEPLVSKHLKNIASDTPPPRCFEPVPEGKGGNMVLPVGCNYCKFRKMCWVDDTGTRMYRSFKYSNGVKHLTTVVNEPKVEEIHE